MLSGTLRARATRTFAEKGFGLGAAGGNPYYPRGECTWYAWSRRPDLPWFSGPGGNAMNWGRSARARGIPTGSDAVPGAIVVLQPGQFYAGPVGHVAYVESVSGDYMHISEWNTTRPHQGPFFRTLRWRNAGLRFIYGGSAGKPPPGPPPPPPAGTHPHHVYHTCANGACGLRLHSAPALGSPVVGNRHDGDEVDIVCQATGDSVSGRDGSSSSVWDRLYGGAYVADYYVDTSGTNGGFSPPLPRCGDAGTYSAESQATVARRPDGTMDLFTEGTDANHSPYHLWIDANGNLIHAWEKLPGSTTGAPNASWNSSASRLDVFVVGTDSKIYRDSYDANSQTWTGFVLVPGNGTGA